MQHEAMRQLGIEDHDQAPPAENFTESAEKRVPPGIAGSGQLIEDHNIEVDAERLAGTGRGTCAPAMKMPTKWRKPTSSNPQIMQQIEPMVIEEQAVEWLVEKWCRKIQKSGLQRVHEAAGLI